MNSKKDKISTTNQKPKALLLKIIWHEGTGEFDGKSYKFWSDFQKPFNEIYANYKRSGGSGYDKVKVEIAWENGKSITDRVDVGKASSDFNPTKETIGAYLKKQTSTMYASNLYVGERLTLSFEDQKSPTKLSNKSKTKLSVNKTLKPKTTGVEDISLEVKFIKRYVLMDGKRKTRSQLLSFINTLQRAMTKKLIRKTSKYAPQIEHIEKELVKIYNDKAIGQSFVFHLDEMDKKLITSLSLIAESQKQLTSVRLISRFIGLQGENADKQKAQRLLSAINLALNRNAIPLSDQYYKKIILLQSELKQFIVSGKEQLVISKTVLRGLQGINNVIGNSGFSPEPIKKKTKEKNTVKKQDGLNGNSTGIISSLEMAKMKHHTCGFTGKWLSLIGDPSSPFSMMFWSRPGKGKSSLAIEFAHYVASKFDKKVLFVAVEEGFNYTIQEKFERLNAVHPNIDIASSMPDLIAAYDIVFIDSVNRAKMIVDDFVYIKKNYPDKSFVLIFQATVDGNYRGGKEWEHEVDVSININENGYAKTQKSRFGGNGSIKVFQGSTDHIYKFSNLQDAEKFVANRKDEKLRIVNGDDGRKWVTNTDKALELKKQGYELY